MCPFSVRRILHQDLYPRKSRLLTLGLYQPLTLVFPSSYIGKNSEALLCISLYAICGCIDIIHILLDGTPGSGWEANVVVHYMEVALYLWSSLSPLSYFCEFPHVSSEHISVPFLITGISFYHFQYCWAQNYPCHSYLLLPPNLLFLIDYPWLVPAAVDFTTLK